MPLTFDENGALLIRDTGNNTFIGLGDTPAAYAGNANRVLVVNATPDAVAFASGLYWDEVNDRLGVNQATPGVDVVVGDDLGTQAGTRLNVGETAGISGFGCGEDVDNRGWFLWDNTADRAYIGTREAATTYNNAITVKTGFVGVNNVLTPSRVLHAMDDSASSGVVIDVMRIESQVDGGAGAAGHGPGFEYTGETTTTENTLMSVTASRWSVATHASRRSRFEIRNYYIGNEVLCGVFEASAVASVDGNSRGVGAIELQSTRTAATQVASGESAVVLGGANNTADELYSTTVGGYEAVASNMGQIASAAGKFSTDGDAQGTLQQLVRRSLSVHVVNTWYSLYPDDGAGPRYVVIPPETGWTFRVLVVGITNQAAQQWSYEIVGLIERDNAGNTTMAAATTTTIFESDANYDCQAVADNVNEALDIQVRRTGGVDYNIRWVATIRTSEVTY